MDIIVEKSYNYAKPLVDEWVKQNPWLVSNEKRVPKETAYATEAMTPIESTAKVTSSNVVVVKNE